MPGNGNKLVISKRPLSIVAAAARLIDKRDWKQEQNNRNLDEFKEVMEKTIVIDYWALIDIELLRKSFCEEEEKNKERSNWQWFQLKRKFPQYFRFVDFY